MDALPRRHGSGSVHELRGWELSITAGTMPQAPALQVTRVAGGIEVRFFGERGVTYRLESNGTPG